MRRTLCTPEDLWCRRPGNEQPEELAAHITPELVAAVGACGVGCRGELAEMLRAKGNCGLQGAIMEAMAWQLTRENGSRSTFDAAADIASRIIEGGEDPATLITDVPGVLSPRARTSEI